MIVNTSRADYNSGIKGGEVSAATPDAVLSCPNAVLSAQGLMMQAIDNTDYQARQGSVAAIIQILNEGLADSSIRTRAVLDQGILQVLCEAPTPEQIPQTQVVEQVRTLLEGISPRGITKARINGRIVQEQQLLWLEEIKRDPKGQLLWSELITLKTVGPLTRLWQDLRSPRRPPQWEAPSRKNKSSQVAFWRGLLGGASLCLLLLLLGWTLKDWLGIELPVARETVEAEAGSTEPVPTPSPPPPPPPAPDAFAQAVTLAQAAAEDGLTASTPAEWLDLAARWQRASDLMAAVPPEDQRYDTAQQRRQVYQENSAAALSQSEAARNTP